MSKHDICSARDNDLAEGGAEPRDRRHEHHAASRAAHSQEKVRDGARSSKHGGIDQGAAEVAIREGSGRQ